MFLSLRPLAQKSVFFFYAWLSIHLGIAFASASALAAERIDSPALARLIFQRIAGKPLLPSHPQYSRMLSLIESGQLAEAAAIPISEDSFYQVKLKTFASSLFSSDESPALPLSDTQAIVPLMRVGSSAGARIWKVN